MFFLKAFSDPILAGRLISIISGFFTMFGLWFLSKELFNKKATYLTMLLYILYPFAQVSNRLANIDSLVAAFYIWSLYFSILLVKKVKLSVAYTLGIVLGGAALTKTNASFSIYLLPITGVLFNFKQSNAKKKFLYLIVLILFAFLIESMMYLILQLSPDYEKIFWANRDFIFSKKLIFLITIIAYPLSIDLNYVFNPYNATIPYIDKYQYVYCSDWGMRDSIPYFNKQSANNKIYVSTEGVYGQIDALDVYLTNNKNVISKGYRIDDKLIPYEILDYTKQIPTFYMGSKGSIMYIPQNVSF
jgi:4-amino-4-deoxy-L-arabinose transferase-like glycosyltransferase